MTLFWLFLENLGRRFIELAEANRERRSAPRPIIEVVKDAWL